MKKFLILAIIALSMLVSVSGIYIPEYPEYNMTINESYTLSEDMLLSTNGIWINESNVVLDGNNYQLTCNNSGGYLTGIYVSPKYGYIIENITIKNFKIKNWHNGIEVSNARNITIINCEFENNERFLESYSWEQYFYLNTIHNGQIAYCDKPLASPKLVYTYNGNEYTYRLGNYYEGYTGVETEDEGVYNGAYDILTGGEVSEVIACDPYPLIKTPENYHVNKEFYPDADPEMPWAYPILTDIFALESGFENYNIVDALVVTSPKRSSGGGGSSYDSDVADDIKSKIIKNFISGATVVYGSDIDKNYSKKLRERVYEYNMTYAYFGDIIIVGGPSVNPLAKKYNDQFEIPISNEVPGENRGIIQVLNVQDNSGNVVKSYTIVYIAGSDRVGTLAALEYFKTLDELPESPITVKWTEDGPVLV
ncbi:right-handed parallel beta-helix repeat-containing protein [Methanococcus sp. CF]